jgi:hypothetical protein
MIDKRVLVGGIAAGAVIGAVLIGATSQRPATQHELVAHPPQQIEASDDAALNGALRLAAAHRC